MEQKNYAAAPNRCAVEQSGFAKAQSNCVEAQNYAAVPNSCVEEQSNSAQEDCKSAAAGFRGLNY